MKQLIQLAILCVVFGFLGAGLKTEYDKARENKRKLEQPKPRDNSLIDLKKLMRRCDELTKYNNKQPLPAKQQ